jgi:hypothetical protein
MKANGMMARAIPAIRMRAQVSWRCAVRHNYARGIESDIDADWAGSDRLLCRLATEEGTITPNLAARRPGIANNMRRCIGCAFYGTSADLSRLRQDPLVVEHVHQTEADLVQAMDPARNTISSKAFRQDRTTE